jgi:serine phosphatase RsbU (regulator of sigma subunit)
MSRDEKAIPGFEVQSVYYSASEVGGDFFLISPSQDGVSNDGSLIVVVGDVSGKGLMAAMRVAMILGVLRREESRNPSEILRNLNDALQNAGSGFTTACCLRLERNGCYTLANAGHISPYIDGREIETSPALPLGLAPDQEYESIAGSLRDRQTIVLLSDGVLEAQSSSGELLGFERLAALTTQPALAIADAAREFGQEDDITVVTVTRRAVA